MEIGRNGCGIGMRKNIMFEAKIKRYKEFFKLLSDMSISHRLTVGNFSGMTGMPVFCGESPLRRSYRRTL